MKVMESLCCEMTFSIDWGHLGNCFENCNEYGSRLQPITASNFQTTIQQLLYTTVVCNDTTVGCFAGNRSTAIIVCSGRVPVLCERVYILDNPG